MIVTLVVSFLIVDINDRFVGPFAFETHASAAAHANDLIASGHDGPLYIAEVRERVERRIYVRRALPAPRPTRRRPRPPLPTPHPLGPSGQAAHAGGLSAIAV